MYCVYITRHTCTMFILLDIHVLCLLDAAQFNGVALNLDLRDDDDSSLDNDDDRSSNDDSDSDKPTSGVSQFFFNT